MLTEQRYEVILKLLEEKNSITVSEVKDLLNTSESTVRRDITALHNAGKLVKVFGGAVACDRTVITHEPRWNRRQKSMWKPNSWWLPRRQH